MSISLQLRSSHSSSHDDIKTDLPSLITGEAGGEYILIKLDTDFAWGRSKTELCHN
jgi:hypothetical protein